MSNHEIFESLGDELNKFDRLNIIDEITIEKICRKIKEEKTIPQLLFVNNAFDEFNIEVDNHQAYFFTSDTLITDRELQGFLYVNMDGLYSNCLGDDMKFILSWDNIIDLELIEENDGVEIQIEMENGYNSIKQENSKSLKIFYFFYKYVWQKVLYKFKEEPIINWNAVLEMGFDIVNFDTIEEYIEWSNDEIISTENNVIGEISYPIDNNSVNLEGRENDKILVQIELFSDGISNKIGNKTKYQKEIGDFLKQWDNTLCYFDDEFLVEDENGDVWILTSPNNPLIVSDYDLYNEDEYLANKDKAVIACLNNIIEFSSSCKFDLGEVGFEDGFYSAIVKLTQLQNNSNGFKLNAKIKTSEGEASGLFNFNELGKITASFNSNEIDGYDDKFLEEAIAEHNAHEEGLDLSAINESDESNTYSHFIQCKFNYKPTYIYLSTCDSIEDAKAQNFEYLGESDANSTGTTAYQITVGDKVIFQYEIPVNHPEEEDLNVDELEGKILVREINVYNSQSIDAFYDPNFEDYGPGSVYFGLAYNFGGITFNVEDEGEGNELDEYVPEEGEGEEQYFEYYHIVNGKPVLFDLDDDNEED